MLSKHFEEYGMHHQQLLVEAVSTLKIKSIDQGVRLDQLEKATYDGIQIWKIDSVKHKMDEAIKGSGVTLSLFSAPFYSDPRGYKMCAR